MGGLDGEYQSATKVLNTSKYLRNQTHTSKGSELGVQPETYVIFLVLVVTSFFVTVLVLVNQNRLVVRVLCL
jgi:hypothetical protein